MNKKVSDDFKKVKNNFYCKPDPKAFFDNMCVSTNNNGIVNRIILYKEKTMIDEKTGYLKNWNAALAIKDELLLKHPKLKCNNLYVTTFNRLVGFNCSVINRKIKTTFKVISPTGMNGHPVSITNIYPSILLRYDTIKEQGF